ncbi:MAG: hypothetical protein OEW20_00555 [Nitrospira sp.]|nr:hypothetical protein [Nitrospira sp.]
MQCRWPTGILWVWIAGLMVCENVGAESTVGTDKIIKEAGETIEATKEYTVQQKEAIERKAHDEVVALQRQIVELRGKVTKASETTRAQLQKSLHDLEKKKDRAKERLDELKGATDAKWHEVQEGMTTALNELKQSYQKLLSHLP